jgi:hypothetical protein
MPVRYRPTNLEIDEVTIGVSLSTNISFTTEEAGWTCPHTSFIMTPAPHILLAQWANILLARNY